MYSLNLFGNGGNDRVNRNFLLNDYSDCGLRIIFDVEAFSQAQKMVWVKHLLDLYYNLILETFGV